MSKLKPTLWRTCRVLAGETRIHLLFGIYSGKDRCVRELAKVAGISEQNASIQLRLLNSRGLITAEHRGMWVIYRAEPNTEVEHAEALLDALRCCYNKKIPVEQVVYAATAFAHLRRILIVKALSRSPMSLSRLEQETGIGSSALLRHLYKLEDRGIVAVRGRRCRLKTPVHPLAKVLLHAACSQELPERIRVDRVISGGQTGADRAGLDAAIGCDVPHGGWCPRGRLTEDGSVPSRYKLQEMEAEDYPSRTRANVAEADLTLIFSHGPLSGGSLLTQQFAEELGKPCVHINLSDRDDGFQALKKLTETFPMSGNIVLNVAGPRASSDPKIYDAVYTQMMHILCR